MLPHSTLVRLCRARDRLRELDDRPHPIRAVAKEAGTSPYHFIRQFAALFGETPHQFRIRARLERARYLLAVGDRSVTEVCLEVGFTSLGSFSALFSRRVGVAPTVYRRQVRSLIAVPGALTRVLIPGCLTLMAGTEGLAIFEKHDVRTLSDFASAREREVRNPCRSSSPA